MTMTTTQHTPTETKPDQPMVLVAREVAFDSYKRGLEPTGLEQAIRIAGILAATGYCGIATPEEALARIMYGRELGLTVMNSIRAVYVVNGRPGLDASVMHALCLQSPACEYFEPLETTNKKAVYRAKRKGRPEVILEWTMQQAEQAGLLGGRPKKGDKGMTEAKDNWVNWPENMLRARCISNLSRMVFPESINGMHTPEELAEGEDVPMLAGPVPTAQVVDASAAKFDAERDALIRRIEVANDKERAAVRGEIQALKKDGSLPAPWITEVTAAYNKAADARKAELAAAGSTAPSTTAPTAAKSEPKPEDKPAPAGETDRGPNPNDH